MLCAVIENDLPPAPVALRATWREMLEIHRRQRENPDDYTVPELPANADGETAADEVLEREAGGIPA